MEEARIVVVEDEGIVAKDLSLRLQSMGHAVLGTAATGQEAIRKTAELRPNLILMDIHLQGDLDGVDTASEIRARYGVPVIYLTAYADEATLRRAKVTEPFGYILKPFEDRELQVLVEMTLYKHRMEQQVKDYTLELSRLYADLERCVLERTAQLHATLSELATFSYTLADRLRTPLHALSGFSGLELNGHSAPLLPKSRRPAQPEQRGELQVDSVVDELLLFKRLEHQALYKETVLPTELVRGVLADLLRDQPSRRVEVQLGDLPVCQASPVLLKYVFTQLLTNALKFSRSRQVTTIEIGTQPREGHCVYFVKDNGVGFDMQHESQLFKLFGRTRPIGEYEGDGTGLAIVQRIVQRHGGQVWATGAVDRGATFFLSLPDESKMHADRYFS